jgi:hypothetical protein
LAKHWQRNSSRMRMRFRHTHRRLSSRSRPQNRLFISRFIPRLTGHRPRRSTPGLVATDDLLGQGLLFPGQSQKVSRLETLRRLRLGPVHHADRHDAGGMHVQRSRKLSGLVLGGRRNLDGRCLACDLRSAGLSGRTGFVIKHSAGGRSSFVVRPPAFMPSINLPLIAINPGP